MRQKEKGQSLIEAVFSIGVIALVITGVAGMMINSFGARTKGYNRKKAAEVGQLVIEDLIKGKIEDPISFWDSGSGFWLARLGSGKTIVSYPRYSYGASFSQFVGNGCVASPVECANISVTVAWSGATETVQFNRFFTRY